MVACANECANTANELRIKVKLQLASISVAEISNGCICDKLTHSAVHQSETSTNREQCPNYGSAQCTRASDSLLAG